MANKLSRTELERFFEEEILVHYHLDTSRIAWKDYVSVDENNTHIHNLSIDDRDYFLVFQYSLVGDYPLDSEGLLIPVAGAAERYIEHRLDEAKLERIENITGYFSLYRLN